MNGSLFSIKHVTKKRIDIDVSENNELVALRVERDERISSVMAELQDKIISSNNTEEKNSAFEELQLLNLAKGKETFLEDKLQDNLGITSFIEINEDNINVTISSKEHNETIANDIMRCIQEEFEDKKNITIKFN